MPPAQHNVTLGLDDRLPPVGKVPGSDCHDGARSDPNIAPPTSSGVTTRPPRMTQDRASSTSMAVDLEMYVVTSFHIEHVRGHRGFPARIWPVLWELYVGRRQGRTR